MLTTSHRDCPLCARRALRLYFFLLDSRKEASEGEELWNMASL